MGSSQSGQSNTGGNQRNSHQARSDIGREKNRNPIIVQHRFVSNNSVSNHKVIGATQNIDSDIVREKNKNPIIEQDHFDSNNSVSNNKVIDTTQNIDVGKQGDSKTIKYLHDYVDQVDIKNYKNTDSEQSKPNVERFEIGINVKSLEEGKPTVSENTVNVQTNVKEKDKATMNSESSEEEETYRFPVNLQGKQKPSYANSQSYQQNKFQSGNSSGVNQEKVNKKQLGPEFNSYQYYKRQANDNKYENRNDECKGYFDEDFKNEPSKSQTVNFYEEQPSEGVRNYQERRQRNNYYMNQSSQNQGRRNKSGDDFKSHQSDQEQHGDQFQRRRNDRQEFRSYQQDMKQNSNQSHPNQRRRNESEYSSNHQNDRDSDSDGKEKSNEKPFGQKFRNDQDDRRHRDGRWFYKDQNERQFARGHYNNRYRDQGNENQGKKYERPKEFRNYQQDKRQGGINQKKSNETCGQDSNNHDRRQTDDYSNQSNEEQSRINERQFGKDFGQDKHSANNQYRERNERRFDEKFTNYQQNRSVTYNCRGNKYYHNRGKRYIHGNQLNSYNREQQQSFKDKYIGDKEVPSRPSSVQSNYENYERNYMSQDFQERPNSSQSDYLVDQRSSSPAKDSSEHDFDFGRGNYKQSGNRRNFQRSQFHPHYRPYGRNFHGNLSDSIQRSKINTFVKCNTREPANVKEENKLNRRDETEKICNRNETTNDEKKEENSELDSDATESNDSCAEIDQAVKVLSVDFRNNFPLDEEDAVRRNINLNEEVKDLLLLGKEGDVVITEQPSTLREMMIFMQKYPNATAVTLKN